MYPVLGLTTRLLPLPSLGLSLLLLAVVLRACAKGVAHVARSPPLQTAMESAKIASSRLEAAFWQRVWALVFSTAEENAEAGEVKRAISG